MESGSPSLPDRSPCSNVNGSGVLGVSRRLSPAQRPMSLLDSPGGQHHQHATQTAHVIRVTVLRDDKGYGMKVSGDNPVYVQSVKEGGAAERAGLHAGDKILKVNGINVMSSTHTEVVQLIRSSVQVELTVQQRASLRAMGSPGPPPRPSSNTRITGPQPVDNRVQHQFQRERELQFRMMIEQESQYIEKLRSEIATSNDEKKISELAKTERNLQSLQEKLQELVKNQRSPLVPHRHHHLQPSSPSCVPLSLDGDSPPPPPLPRRNNDPTTTNGRELVDNCLYSVGSGKSSSSSPPPPLPPRAPLDHHDKPNSINKQLSYPLVATCATLVNHSLPSHQRAKSSPDSLLGLSPAEASKRLIASESMNNLNRQEGWETPPPPGTPPPPYPCPMSAEAEESSDGTHLDEPSVEESRIIYAATPNVQQTPIISMEDDEMSDQEINQVDDHGPFKSLSRLREKLPHLAVFTNYVLLNSDPDCLFFYLLTDLYKEGNAKEMRKWAFEIHSCFLVPGAPLRLPNVDENIAREIDDVLSREYDKEEILRKIFWKARSRAKEELTKQLVDFKQKRTAGLGTMFGPGDVQLQEALQDKTKEQKLYESLILPKLEPFSDELDKDNYDPRRYYTAAALTTIATRIFGVRLNPGMANYNADRWPTFVSKERSLKTRLMGRYSRKLNVGGHQYTAQQYFTVISCKHCHQIIYGISPQGYQCSVCLINLHRPCVRLYDDACPGPINKKDRGLGKFIRMRHDANEHRRKHSAHFIHMEKERRQAEDLEMSVENIDVKPGQPVSRSGSDRRPDSSQEQTTRTADSAAQDHAQDTTSPAADSGASVQSGLTGACNKRKAATNINRSESVKEVSEKRKQRRNISDPSHNSHHVEFDQQGAPTPLMSGSTISHTDSGSSSNSSISCNGRLSESPSNSAEVLSNLIAGNSDSDMDAEDTTPNWQELVPEEQLKNLKPHEKKRQDVINEFFQTEESHVRSLRALYKIFYKTLHEHQTLKPDELHLVFPNIKEVLDIHMNISREMKKKRKEDPLVRQLGDLVSAMFDERLSKAAAAFCERQQQALDFIKERRKRDSKFDGVLCECEKKRQCRRLPLQGILPVEMQRLSKYPLLLERLIGSVEEENVEELAKLKRAHQACKDVLNRVNEAAKQASNKARLDEIQRHLDTSNFERAVENLAPEFRSVDLTRYTYVLEGPMQLRRPNKGPVPVHILLLEEAVVLLQREGERYVLKFFQSGSSAQPQPLSPIIKMSTLLVRTNAVHKSALFLVNTSTNNSQMYDLIAEDDHKRDQWFKHFSDASDAYNGREGKTKRPESGGDLPSDGLSQDSGHESVEEIPQPENAVAECTSSPVDDAELQASTENTSPEVTGEGEGDGTNDTSTKLGPEDWPLVEPSQVQVLTAPVHVAESKLTPLEQIRRKDEQVRQALEAKEALVADLLNIPREHFHDIADMAGETRDDVTELILSAIHQSNQLHAAINSASNVTESEAVAVTGGLPTCASQENLHRLQQPQHPSVPCHTLLPIATALSNQFTALLSATKRLEEERDRYRKEVHRLRERLHHDNELHVSASVANPSVDSDQTTGNTVDNGDPEECASPSE